MLFKEIEYLSISVKMSLFLSTKKTFLKQRNCLNSDSIKAEAQKSSKSLNSDSIKAIAQNNF